MQTALRKSPEPYPHGVRTASGTSHGNPPENAAQSPQTLWGRPPNSGASLENPLVPMWGCLFFCFLRGTPPTRWVFPFRLVFYIHPPTSPSPPNKKNKSQSFESRIGPRAARLQRPLRRDLAQHPQPREGQVPHSSHLASGFQSLRGQLSWVLRGRQDLNLEPQA